MMRPWSGCTNVGRPRACLLCLTAGLPSNTWQAGMLTVPLYLCACGSQTVVGTVTEDTPALVAFHHMAMDHKR